MICLERGVVWSRVASADDAERGWLAAQLSCPLIIYVRGRFGIRRVESKYFLLRADGSFPSGLVGKVVDSGRRDQFPVSVVDCRGPAPCVADPSADLSWLRPYQLKAARNLAVAGVGVLKAVTGSGKTEVMVALTRMLPCEWCLVVHRGDLVEQAARRYLLRTGETSGRLDSSAWARGTGNFTCTTFQMLRSGMRSRSAAVLDFLCRVEGVLVDEVHAQPADSFYGVTMVMPRAYYRFGFSGTPFDRDEVATLKTVAALGPLVHEVPKSELIALGVISMPSVRMVPCRQDGRRADPWDTVALVAEAERPGPLPHRTWHQVYRDLVVRSGVRNDLLVQMCIRARKPCLCFVEEYDHGARLLSGLRAAGVSCEFATGDDALDARQARIGRLVQGRCEVLLCTVIFQEGVDVPELESVVVGTGKESVVGVLQRVGRGMRACAGKVGFEVWDVLDAGQRWLAAHARGRRAAYEREGYAVEVGWPEGNGQVLPQGGETGSAASRARSASAPANEGGRVTDWGEVAGGRGASREEAIEELEEGHEEY